MFTNDVREAKQEEIKMEGVDPEALKALVHFAYTGEYLHSTCRLFYDFFFSLMPVGKHSFTNKN